jgi:peroxiredoxin
MRNEYNPGGTFPDWVLPDHTGTARRLSLLQGGAPMLVVLIRSASCQWDLKQLRELTNFHPVLLTEGCRLVAVTTDDWRTTKQLRQQLHARYPFLCDKDKTLRDKLDIWDYSDPARLPMIPYTFLLAPRLRIRRLWNGHYYWGRPTTSELHAELRELMSKMPPDGDSSNLEFSDQWGAGNGRNFHPSAAAAAVDEDFALQPRPVWRAFPG